MIAVANRGKPKQSRMSVLERRWGLIFIAPWLLGLFLFQIGPMLASLVLSFTDFNLISPDPMKFIGLRNWERLFTDPIVFKSLLVTLRYLIIVVPFLIISPLLVALILNSKSVLARGFFLTLFFVPQLIPAVVTGLIWQGTMSSRGPINQFLERLGLPGPQWLTEAAWVMPAIAIIGLWSIGNTILTMMAALKNVPTELYEAARIDGATPIQSFFKITMPLMSAVIFYTVITGVIGAFQYFTITFLLYRGQGGPDDSALFYMLLLYKESFVYYNMGFASTLAWGMFVVCLAITQLLFATARRWVYYAGEGRS
jgi:multiple sugar transport system permease protein